MMSKFYQDGIGVEIDEIKAFEYKKSAKKVEKEQMEVFQTILGHLNQNGKYIQKDLEKVANLYCKIKGKDLGKGFYWFYKTLEKAAENGNELVQFILGSCYEDGIGVERDETKAFEYYIK